MKNFLRIKSQISNYFYDKLMPVNSRISYTLESIIILLNYRFFKKQYKFLKESEYWSEKDLKNYQEDRLNKLINHAYNNVKYYKVLFDKNNIKPGNIKTLEDLRKIPLLSRDNIRGKTEQFKATNFSNYSFGAIETGGTTSKPTTIFVEKSISYVSDVSYFKTVFDRMNCELLNKIAIIRGEHIPGADKGKIWKYSFFRRILVLSSYHLTKENLPKYINKLQKFKPKIIIAFPSSLTLIVKYMKSNNIKSFESINGIITGAEKLYNWQRSLIEEFFDCRIIECYGHTERAVKAATCEKSNYFHFFPQFGIVELIDEKGKPINKEGEIGEIVATGFDNDLFPFIRYKTGDLGVYTKDKCNCGRNFPLVKNIAGRTFEFIATKKDKYLSFSSIDLDLKVFKNVRQFQFYQNKKGKIILRIEKSKRFTKDEEEQLKKEIIKKFGNDIDVSIDYVNNFSRTARGKHKYLIQELETPFTK